MNHVYCNLRVPRHDDATGVPAAWMHDLGLSAAARGFVAMLLIQTPPGRPTDLGLFEQHPDDPPISEVMAELLDAGYLIPTGPSEWELVHPGRLAPLDN